MDYIDKKFDGFRDDLKTQLDKQDVILERIDSKVQLLDEKLGQHAGLPGHPLGMQRLEGVETRLKKDEEKPWKAWQIITGAIALILYLCSLGFTAISIGLSLLTLILHITGH